MTGIAARPIPKPRLVTERAFADWLIQAKPGDELVYHVGFLAAERGDLNTRQLEATIGEATWMGDATRRALWARLDMSRVADLAMDHSREKVRLVQRRLGEGKYEYIAIRRPTPGPAELPAPRLVARYGN